MHHFRVKTDDTGQLFTRGALLKGRCWKRLCPGCEISVMIFPACFLVLEEYMSWREGRGASNDFFLFLLSSLLQSVPIVFCGSSEPDCDGCAQDRFDDCGVELAQQLLWQTIFLQLPKKVHLLLGLFWGWSRWLSPTSGHRKLLFPEMWRSPLLTLCCWISKSSAEGCLLKSAVFSVRLSPAALMSLSTPRGSLRGPPTGKHSQWAEVAPS